METSSSIDWQTWAALAAVALTLVIVLRKRFFPKGGKKHGNCHKCH